MGIESSSVGVDGITEIPKKPTGGSARDAAGNIMGPSSGQDRASARPKRGAMQGPKGVP